MLKITALLIALSKSLLKTKSVTIHTRNLRLLLLEVFIPIKRLNPEIMCDTFAQKFCSHYAVAVLFIFREYISTSSGLNPFDFRASLAWDKLPPVIKDLSTISLSPLL